MDALACFRISRACAHSPGWQIAEPRQARYGATCSPGEQSILREAVGELQLAISVLAVATAALRRQNADHDADVAEVLERFASDRLDVQREKLQRLLEQSAEGVRRSRASA